MKPKNLFLIVGLLLSPWLGALAQEGEPIHITGVVVSADSLEPVPFTNIIVKNSGKGTVSDNSGYFSLYANELDTLAFTNVGFKEAIFIVPDSLPKSQYGLVQVMQKDTVLLSEVKIYAFPTAEDFKEAFMAIELEENQKDRTRKLQAKLQEPLREAWENNRYYYDWMRYSKMYELSGIIPPNNFLNPLTWSEFIRNWKEGAYKNTEENYYPSFNEDE